MRMDQFMEYRWRLAELGVIRAAAIHLESKGIEARAIVLEGQVIEHFRILHYRSMRPSLKTATILALRCILSAIEDGIAVALAELRESRRGNR